MIRIEIAPQWRFRRDDNDEVALVLLDFLNEIRATGKITRAASHANLSYRHAWNLIEHWGKFFDQPLVERHRGKGTVLTPLGERLVWAGQRLQARLGPLLQNLAQELETEINQVLPHSPNSLRIHSSHGFAVSKLREMLDQETDLNVDLRYVVSPASLVALMRDGCDVAGMHLPQGPLRKRNIKTALGYITPERYRVIGFVTREMGLIVKRGNPLKIYNLERLLDPTVRFVNRDLNSGSRLVFDQLLAQHALDPKGIQGYQKMEFTHAAVAAYVASGMADVAFGVEAAARQFDLDFVRLLTEDYFLVCRVEALEQEPVKQLMALMQSSAFHEAILQLPGYTPKDMGRVRDIKQVFQSSSD
jgi:molybdate transport repressor ModE-like protein